MKHLTKSLDMKTNMVICYCGFQFEAKLKNDKFLTHDKELTNCKLCLIEYYKFTMEK